MSIVLDYIIEEALAAASFATDSWISLGVVAQALLCVVMLLVSVMFLLVGYHCAKIAKLQREKFAVSDILEKEEKKAGGLGAEKNRLLRVLFNFNDGVLVLDESNKIFFANMEAQRIIGLKSRELEGMHLSELKILSEFRPFATSLFFAKDAESKEIVLSGHFVSFSVNKIYFDENKAGKVIIIRDITKEKLAEKAKNDFLLSAIHQLKTSMSSVRWLIKMFLDGDFGKLTKNQKDAVKKLYERNESIFPLIGDLLDAAKIDDGAFKYNKTSVDIENIVESSLDYFKEKIEDKKIRINFKKPESQLPKIKADKAKIETVMHNLFDNALKYTPENGIIDLFLDKNNKEIEFCIRDSGMGIPESQQPEIFGKFFRAKNALSLEKTGSGLGLFIAKKIVEDHGGKIWFDSKEGEGSSFYFTLPV